MRCRGLDGAWGRWHLSDYGGRWVCVEVLGGDVGALINGSGGCTRNLKGCGGCGW